VTDTTYLESALVFECGGERLLGVISRPARPARAGIVIVVGGPQYRIGSHRQFLLLARDLARAGFAVMRFDYRGMGDSEGQTCSFEAVDDDIAAAIDAFVPGWPAAAAGAGVRIVEALGPLDFLRLAGHASMVLTDSGGLQKEAFLLGVPCVTLRTSTEWVETIDCGANILATDALSVDDAISRHLEAPGERASRRARARELYGARRAGARIAHGLGTLGMEGRS
jgi:hypothetical protein